MTEVQTFQQNTAVLCLKNNSCYKDCMKDVTFTWPTPVLHMENSVTMLFFSAHLYPEKVVRHMTSNFDVCDVDLDMEMSFLNTVP